MFLNITNLILAILIYLFSMSSGVASETIFKCIRPDGGVVYSENKCKANEKHIQSKDMEDLNALNHANKDMEDFNALNHANVVEVEVNAKNEKRKIKPNSDKSTIDQNIASQSIPPLPPLPDLPVVSEISKSFKRH